MSLEITIQKYKLRGATWNVENLGEYPAELAQKMTELPFASSGDQDELKYGFGKCGLYGGVAIYGLFIQRYVTTIKDYDELTKEGHRESTINSGEYFFLLRLDTKELYLQLKRSGDLPSSDVIANRFEGMLLFAFSGLPIIFSDLEKAREEVDREKIVDIFYNQSTQITELEFSDFDEALIDEEKQKRNGKRQTYFNPIEEYQEAMEAGAVRFAHNVEKASIKAKPEATLYKDPIARAMLEGSRKPTKITFIKDGEQITESSITRSKETISIEVSDMNEIDEVHIESIISRIRSGLHSRNSRPNIESTPQSSLFSDEQY